MRIRESALREAEAAELETIDEEELVEVKGGGAATGARSLITMVEVSVQGA